MPVFFFCHVCRCMSWVNACGTICTSPTHHRHMHPLDTPNNTHTTHLPSSRHNLGIKTPQYPDLTDIRIKYQSNTTMYTHTHCHTYLLTTYTYTRGKKKHRHYKPCLPQGHYGCHILCFHLLTGRTPHAVRHGPVLMMGIMVPKTCWDRMFDNKHRISCILLVLSLHLM